MCPGAGFKPGKEILTLGIEHPGHTLVAPQVKPLSEQPAGLLIGQWPPSGTRVRATFFCFCRMACNQCNYER
jgi:hypothetical protein